MEWKVDNREAVPVDDECVWDITCVGHTDQMAGLVAFRWENTLLSDGRTFSDGRTRYFQIA
jgi:hypothetical protein